MPRLFIPGMLTIHYIAGKRQKYFTPGRLFFISMLFFLALIKITIIPSEDLKQTENKINKQATLNSLSEEYDSILNSNKSSIKDSVFLKKLKEKLITSKLDRKLNENLDSIINEATSNSTIPTEFDSILSNNKEILKDSALLSNLKEELLEGKMDKEFEELDSLSKENRFIATTKDENPGINLSIHLPQPNNDGDNDSLNSNNDVLTVNEFLASSPKEFADKIGRQDSFSLFLISQFQKLFKDLGNSINFIIGNMIWAIFFMVFIIALILKFLYIREGRFYVEHVVFQMHYISSVLWLLNILFILTWLNLMKGPKENPTAFALAIFFELILLYFAMKRYYQQGLFKTMIKYFIILFGYFFVSIVCLLITAGISVLFI